MAKVPKRSKKTAPPKKAKRRIPKKKAVRRTKEFKRRSIAAKKGWAARRLKQEIKNDRTRANALTHMAETGAETLKRGMTPEGAASILGRGMREPKPRLKRSPAIPGLGVPVDERIRELERLLAEERDRVENLLAEADRVGWVPDMDGWMRADGSRAVCFSRLRTFSLEDREAIMLQLDAARENGRLAEEAMRVAFEQGCPLREVYTLMASP